MEKEEKEGGRVEVRENILTYGVQKCVGSEIRKGKNMSEWITEKSDIKESKIEERTGLKPGIVWINGKTFENNICLYDCNSANFHLLPDLDLEDAKDVKDALEGYLNEVGDVRKELIKIIENEIIENERRLSDLKIDEGEGKKGSLSPTQYPPEYKERGICNAFYKHILLYDGQRYYTINFMRWYIDKERKVNCRFGEIQFDTTKNKVQRVNTANTEKDIIRYPKSYIGQSEKMIRLDGEDQVCIYNPKDVGNIWEINKCEKKRKKWSRNFVIFMKK